MRWVELVGQSEYPHYAEYFKDKLLQDEQLWLPHFTIEDVLSALNEGSYQGWIGGYECFYEIYAITQVHQYPRTKVLSVLWCHGDQAPAYHAIFVDKLSQLAKIVGASHIEVRGRPGWSKALASLGFKPTQLILSKEVEHGGQGSTLEYHADK